MNQDKDKKVVKRNFVLQDWVMTLSLMQQSVLLSAIRGPDGVEKNSPVKNICKWYRRCVLYSAFSNTVLTDPFSPGGGSFTGPVNSPIPEKEPKFKPQLDTLGGMSSLQIPLVEIYNYIPWEERMVPAVTDMLKTRDSLNFHYFTHLMFAIEILGYKHPEERVRVWWHNLYIRMVSSLHLYPETEEALDKRLGDNEADWKERNA